MSFFKNSIENLINVYELYVVISYILTSSFGAQVCIIRGRRIGDSTRCSLINVTPFSIFKLKFTNWFKLDSKKNDFYIVTNNVSTSQANSWWSCSRHVAQNSDMACLCLVCQNETQEKSRTCEGLQLLCRLECQVERCPLCQPFNLNFNKFYKLYSFSV